MCRPWSGLAACAAPAATQQPRIVMPHSSEHQWLNVTASATCVLLWQSVFVSGLHTQPSHHRIARCQNGPACRYSSRTSRRRCSHSRLDTQVSIKAMQLAVFTLAPTEESTHIVVVVPHFSEDAHSSEGGDDLDVIIACALATKHEADCCLLKAIGSCN